jgi:preprotein translocase subunit SecD
VSPTDIDAAVQVIRNRIDALGVTEPLVQKSGDRRIIVELPGVTNPGLAISTIQEQAFLEFVDAGFTLIPDGTQIRTSIATTAGTGSAQAVTSTLESTSVVPVTNTLGLTSTGTPHRATAQLYHHHQRH